MARVNSPRIQRAPKARTPAADAARSAVEPAHDSIEQRTLQAAIDLAVEGGFAAVRQRDVAARARVALGTLYSRYGSKELLLISALELDADALESDLARAPAAGKTPQARATALFARATQRFISRPKLGKAILRATVSGDPSCTIKLMEYQARLSKLLVTALVGAGLPAGKSHTMSIDAAHKAATLLIMIWHSNLVGWSGGAASYEVVVAVMEHAARVILRGVVPAAPGEHE